MPLSEAEQRLYAAIHPALLAYQDEVRLGHPDLERRCMICEVPVSRCCCSVKDVCEMINTAF